mmetsp:Transcript_151365/g.384739  ORF Transcript_151365/g.384739 Transcript_151365/m.384739 type:complete len:507 (+) Transcript_151365:129-1649(+)
MPGGMAANGATASSTVCVQLPPDQCPGSLQQATALFSRFGDIARVDMTLGSTTGRSLVTFFDIRSAEKLISELKGHAEMFPPAAHDFRAISIASSVFAELPPTFMGFQTFGEIAGVSISGEDMVVEFYDMRAAQQATQKVPGCRARRPQAASAELDTAASAVAAATATAQACAEAKGLPSPELLQSLTESLGRIESELGATAAAMHSQGISPGVVSTTAAKGYYDPRGLHMSQPNALANGFAPTCAQPYRASSTALAAGVPLSTPAPNVAKGGPVSAGPGKPVREKVDSKDLTKFDIIPEKVRSGADTRTTVMVRNIPKACTREHFVEILANFGLNDSYTFFYMPFDKRRNVHCGFAFVNFQTPEDILTLHEGLQHSLMRLCSNSTPPALSYARLQGQEQLMKHFSLSAVMHDSDARKRPVFVRGGHNSNQNSNNYYQEPKQPEPQVSAMDQWASQGFMAAKLNAPGGDMQPRYVISNVMKDKGATLAEQLEAESANFMLSSAMGG